MYAFVPPQQGSGYVTRRQRSTLRGERETPSSSVRTVGCREVFRPSPRGFRKRARIPGPTGPRATAAWTPARGGRNVERPSDSQTKGEGHGKMEGRKERCQTLKPDQTDGPTWPGGIAAASRVRPGRNIALPPPPNRKPDYLREVADFLLCP